MGKRDVPFFRLLDSLFPSLTPSQARVADYLRNHYKEAVFLSLAQTARNAGVSEASVLRLARSLGYNGYSELQSVLQSYVSASMLTTVERFQSYDQVPDDATVFRDLLEKTADSMKTLSHLVSPAEVKSFVASLGLYRNILVVGFESTAGLAEYLCYYLHRTGYPATAVTEKTGDLFAVLQTAGKETLALAILVARYPRTAIEFCSSCAARGSALAVVSDTSDHPLFDSVSSQFSVSTKRFDGMNLENQAAMLSFLQGLILECGLGDRKRTKQTLKALEDYNRSFHIFD